MARRQPQSGLTLIELLITLLIAAIVAAMVAPSFAQTMGERRVTTGARAFAATLRKAQAAALARNRIIEVTFTASDPVPGSASSATSAGASTGRWLARVTPAAGEADFVDGYASSTQLPGVTIEATESRVGFTPLGRPVLFGGAGPTALDSTVVLRFTDQPTSRRMCAYLTTGGAVRVCDPRRDAGHPAACRPQLAAGAC